jgi:hypothetical protein
MSSPKAINDLLPAPVILEASGTSGIETIAVDALGSSGATLEIPNNAVKSGDRVRAWSDSNNTVIIDEIKTVGSNANPLTFSVAKEKLVKGSHVTFVYVLLNDKDEPTEISRIALYSII